jgi:hypothetical protein
VHRGSCWQIFGAGGAFLPLGEGERRRGEKEEEEKKKREKRLIRTTVDFNYHVHESNSITLLIQKCMP